MDPFSILIGLLIGLLAGAGMFWAMRRRSPDERNGELVGRLSQMAESQAAQQAQFADRLQAQERALALAMETRLAELGKRLAEGLDQSTQRTSHSLHELRERLTVIDTAQRNITELSQQMVSLKDILSNKQARGAFGELQLADLVQSILPPSAYEFQAALGEGRRVDCLLTLPNPPGPIAIDAKFPLESYHALRQAGDEASRQAAGRAFATAVNTHVRDIAAKYIVPGETAESALMFLPSEAVYAELHANFPDVVDRSYRAKVWIVSPTTLMATLNTVRAVLKDVRMREQADLIQNEVRHLMDDIRRLDDRVEKLQSHFNAAQDDVRQIRISTDKAVKRASRIEDVQLGAVEKTELLT